MIFLIEDLKNDWHAVVLRIDGWKMLSARMARYIGTDLAHGSAASAASAREPL